VGEAAAISKIQWQCNFFDYCAPQFRLYLINSPVVRAEVLKFQENGVRDVVKDVFLPWYNAYRFLIQNVHRLETVSVSSTCLVFGVLSLFSTYLVVRVLI